MGALEGGASVGLYATRARPGSAREHILGAQVVLVMQNQACSRIRLTARLLIHTEWHIRLRLRHRLQQPTVCGERELG